MPRKIIALGLVVTGSVVFGLSAGYLWGFYGCKKQIMDRLEEEDVFAQFIDILGGSNGIDGVEWDE